MSNHEWTDLAGVSRQVWEQNAAFWDDYMGEASNDFHNLLVRPGTERLLEVQAGQTVLDVACGNGNFSRRLAELGAQVIAIDGSETMISRAQQRTPSQINSLTYQIIDATNAAQLLALGESRFDAAVANMALMDPATLEPLLTSLTRLLKPGGRFVFSVIHPCFQAPGMIKMVEEEDRAGEIIVRQAIKLTSYITPTSLKGIGIIGQPTPQYYFHRPLSVLFKTCFQAGFSVDGLEEPVFDLEIEGNRPFSWANFKEIPPVLVVRLRPLPTGF